MKNRQLIKELLEFPMDADVTLTYSEDIMLSYVTDKGDEKSSAKVVFIEQSDYRSDKY